MKHIVVFTVLFLLMLRLKCPRKKWTFITTMNTIPFPKCLHQFRKGGDWLDTWLGSETVSASISWPSRTVSVKGLVYSTSKGATWGHAGWKSRRVSTSFLTTALHIKSQGKKRCEGKHALAAPFHTLSYRYWHTQSPCQGPSAQYPRLQIKAVLPDTVESRVQGAEEALGPLVLHRPSRASQVGCCTSRASVLWGCREGRYARSRGAEAAEATEAGRTQEALLFLFSPPPAELRFNFQVSAKTLQMCQPSTDRAQGLHPRSVIWGVSFPLNINKCL